jgi:hypothetical protein
MYCLMVEGLHRFNFQVRALLFLNATLSPKNGGPEQKTHAAITFLSQLPEGLFPDTSHWRDKQCLS